MKIKKIYLMFVFILFFACSNVYPQNESNYNEVLMKKVKEPHSTGELDEEIELFKKCLLMGANVNLKDEFGETLLMFATKNSSVKLMEELILAGADIDAQDYKGNTALMYSAMYVLSLCNTWSIKEIPRTTELLLRFNLDINKRNKQGKTAFALAVETGHKETAELIKLYGGIE